MSLSRFAFCVSVIALISCGRVASRPQPLRSEGHHHCQAVTWEYKQSALEAAFVAEVHKWDGETPESVYCKFKAQYEDKADYWLAATARLMQTERVSLPDAPNDVFSSFVTELECRGGATATHVSWIEPLAFGLRYPKAHCEAPIMAMFNRTYLLLASAMDYMPQHTGRLTGGMRAGRRAFLFDAGASLWSEGGGGPSQSWIIQAYGTRGIRFDRILMWEATPHTAQEIFEGVPRDLYDAYQYFNVPVSANVSDPANPLNIMKRITTPEDFVVFKLDIDNVDLENAFVQQMLNDPEVHSRIDEFFYEHHVKWQGMVAYWPAVWDVTQTFGDSYDLFLQLRKRGIRAHSWP